MRKGQFKLTPNQINRLIVLYESGKSLSQLSRKFNLAHENCRHILIRNNIGRRGFDSGRNFV